MEYVRKVHIYKNHKNGNCAARVSGVPNRSRGTAIGMGLQVEWAGRKDPSRITRDCAERQHQLLALRSEGSPKSKVWKLQCVETCATRSCHRTRYPLVSRSSSQLPSRYTSSRITRGAT